MEEKIMEDNSKGIRRDGRNEGDQNRRSSDISADCC